MFSLGKKKTTTEKLDKILRNPKILEVNLIKDEVSLTFDWKKNGKGLLVALVVTALVIFELYAGLDWWQKDEEARLEELKTKIVQQSKDIKNFRELAAPALTYKERTVEVGNLLNNHIYWTNFFSWLEKNTLSTVSYGGFSGELDGKYTLSASASSYAEAAWQVNKLLDDPLTTKATVDSVTARGNKTKLELAKEIAEAAKKKAEGEDIASEEVKDVESSEESGVNFAISLEVKPEIFKNNYQND